MKMIKKLVYFAMALACAFGGVVGNSGVLEAKAVENEILNVYLIAGQSNAVGLSKTDSITDAEKLAEYTAGYSNVLYRGRGDSVNITNYTTTVTTGLGSTAAHVGTEVGIAEVISKNDPDRKSLIIKRAVGGTYLVDEKTVTDQNGGNWCPPSMRSETPLSELTGVLYDQFVDLVEESVEYYQAEGYTVHLKGTFWMQGEAETDSSARAQQYETHLTALINDLREDFEPIFDNYAPSAPFVIGKIAPTFNGGNGYVDEVRAAQNRVAVSLSRVYTVETDDYVIVDPTTQLPADGCYDRYHFCGDDIVALGRDVANCFLENNIPALEVVTGKNGSADMHYREFDGENITVTFTPNTHFSIGKLIKNGVDVTEQMNGNTFVVEDTDEYVILKMEFLEDAKYTMKLDYNRDCGEIQKSLYGYYYYAGQTVAVKVQPIKGYVVKEVKFDGMKLTANANGEYEVVITSGANKLSVIFDEVAEVEPPKTEDTAPPIAGNKCCGSFVGGYSVWLVLGCVGGLALKRRKN